MFQRPNNVFSLPFNLHFSIVWVILLACFLPNRAEAQFLFREKTGDCYAHQFQLESDTLMVDYVDTTLIRQLRSGFNPLMNGVVTGKILMQILVGPDGRACLMSYENNTNLPNDFLNLQATIQQQVKLKGQSQVMCLVIRLTLNKDESTLKRWMYHPTAGWLEK